MTMTEIISVHTFRRSARKVERMATRVLNMREEAKTSPFTSPDIELWRGGPVLPGWAGGVRVEKAGLFQHAVVATVNKGH
jgi:hypothetical protein